MTTLEFRLEPLEYQKTEMVKSKMHFCGMGDKVEWWSERGVSGNYGTALDAKEYIDTFLNIDQEALCQKKRK